jgi:hypothetical protein
MLSASLTSLEGATMPAVASDIDKEIAAYDALRNDLEAQHMGKWVLVHDGKLVAVFDSFEIAAEDAVRKFGRGPYLIRQVGAPPITLPASVMYHPA